MEEQPLSTGAAVRALRIATGLTLEQVAREAGVSATHLSRVETGKKNANPAWLGAVISAISQHFQSEAA